MRYSILVYIIRMCETLMEAEYCLRGVSVKKSRTEVIASGRTMLDKIADALEQYRAAVKDEKILEQLHNICEKWESAGTDESLYVDLLTFSQNLPKAVNYQIKAVFFAELGQKWDAMASVYEFMRADPRFDPSVVLTPIFRQVQQEDGEIKQDVIYEDYLTKLNIPFYGYNEYDISKDCPELAFMCQPYESCTLPQFWAENIAKYTRIVYTSYFLPGIVLRDYPKSMCTMPVYEYAWKVIGLNEKHRQYYCKYHHHGGRNMLVTGVPKTDPLVRLKKEGIPFPENWGKIRGKKIFLWNSWYSVLVSSVQFAEDILDWFQEHQDCALIWRPHPMTDMVTRLYCDEDDYNRYCENVRWVENSDNMVMDHNVDCYASFYYSDALFSDHSSMMEQYIFMDKPVLWIQNQKEEMTGEAFIPYDWMETADGEDEIIQFLDRIRQGLDTKAPLRKQTLEEDHKLSDGHCAERICNALWTQLHQEDLIQL